MRNASWWLACVVLVLSFAALGCQGGACTGDCKCSGNECICPSQGDCAIDCTEACDLQCAGSGNCDFVCNNQCEASCTGSGECLVAVGDDSTISCTGSGDCDITCTGDCVVECPGSGDCLMRCVNEDEGAQCRFERCEGEIADCGENVSICGRSGCP
jgi:hypothetical protein